MKLILFSLLFCFTAHAELVNECNQTYAEWMQDNTRCFERIDGITYESAFDYDKLEIRKHSDWSDEEFETQWVLVD